MRLIYTTLLFLLFSTLHGQTFQDAFPNLNFSRPVDIQNSGVPGDNRLFIVEQDGRIRVVQNQSNTSSSSVFLDIRSKVNFTNGQEKGLLGLAFHPNYQQNGQFYVSYTGLSGGFIRIIIERYTVSSNNQNFANSNTACQVIAFNKNQNNSNHNGGSINFGPDGFLYASIGDGGGGNDPRDHAQNLNSLFGKILRLDVNVSCSGYRTTGNPLVGNSGRNEIYAWGLRNSWRMSWDFQTNRLWAGDVGQGEFEEINIIQRGRNYGWKYYEARSVANGNSPRPSNSVFPVYSYNHNQGDQSITGGYVYRGSEISNLNGRYIFGDFASGRVWSLNTGNNSRSLLFNTSFSISTFGQDINNEVYFTDYGSGKIYKIISENTPPPPPPSDDQSFTSNGCTISMSGLNDDSFIKVFDAGFSELWVCSPYNGSPCSANESYTAPSAGTYFVQGRDGALTRIELNGCGGSSGPTNDPSNNDPTNNPPNNSGPCSVSSQNCTITINNLNSNDFVKVFDAGFNEVFTCNPYNGSPCSANESYTAPSAGTYFVQECDGSVTRFNLTGCNGSGGNGSGGNGDERLVHIRKRNATGFAIDGQNGATNGQNVTLWTQNSNNDNQQWIEEPIGNDYYIYRKQGTNHCLDGGNGGANRQKVKLFNCNDNNQNQHWRKENVDGGFVRLRKRNAQGFVLDGGSGGSRGQNVGLFDAGNSSQNLHWLIQEISGVSIRSVEANGSENQIDEVKISPNPTEGNLTVNISNYLDQSVNIFLTDLSGKIYLTEKLDRDHSPILHLDISPFQNGIYFLYIKAEDRKAVVKKVSLINTY